MAVDFMPMEPLPYYPSFPYAQTYEPFMFAAPPATTGGPFPPRDPGRGPGFRGRGGKHGGSSRHRGGSTQGRGGGSRKRPYQQDSQYPPSLHQLRRDNSKQMREHYRDGSNDAPGGQFSLPRTMPREPTHRTINSTPRATPARLGKADGYQGLVENPFVPPKDGKVAVWSNGIGNMEPDALQWLASMDIDLANEGPFKRRGTESDEDSYGSDFGESDDDTSPTAAAAAADGGGDVAGSVPELQAQLKDKTFEVATLQSKLDALQEENATLREQSRALREEHMTLGERNFLLEQELADLKRERAAAATAGTAEKATVMTHRSSPLRMEMSGGEMLQNDAEGGGVLSPTNSSAQFAGEGAALQAAEQPNLASSR